MNESASHSPVTEAATSRFAQVDGFRFHYHEAGSGEPQ